MVRQQFRETAVFGTVLLALICVQAPGGSPPPDNPPLIEAAAHGDVALVKKLLAQGADPNTRSIVPIKSVDVKTPWATISNYTIPGGATALHAAVARKQGEVIAVLFQHKVNPALKDDQGHTAFHYAVSLGDVALVKTLLQHGATLKDEPGLFSHAICLGWTDLARFLLGQGADINQGDATGNTALHWAVAQGDFKTAEWLVAQGADLNRKANPTAATGGQTPLIVALHAGRADMVKFLLQHGADQTIPDNAKKTPLEITIDKNNLDAAKLFLAAADKKFLNKQLFLHKTIKNGYVVLLPLFLKAGADINAQDEMGYTPLHLACQRHFPDVVSVLLQHKPNLGAADKAGRTPLFHAVLGAARVTTSKSGLIQAGNPFLFPDPLGKPPAPEPKKQGPVFPEGQHDEKGLEILKLLLDGGAKVNMADKQGLTPLHYAALVEDEKRFHELTGLVAHPHTMTFFGNASYWTTDVKYNGFEAARLLLKQGADPAAKTKASQTPLDLCINSKTRELLAKALKAAQ
jgi:ankyrin repeat protein